MSGSYQAFVGEVENPLPFLINQFSCRYRMPANTLVIGEVAVSHRELSGGSIWF